MDRFFSASLRSIHHDGSSRYVVLDKAGMHQFGDWVTIRLRVGIDVPFERVLQRGRDGRRLPNTTVGIWLAFNSV